MHIIPNCVEQASTYYALVGSFLPSFDNIMPEKVQFPGKLFTSDWITTIQHKDCNISELSKIQTLKVKRIAIYFNSVSRGLLWTYLTATNVTEMQKTKINVKTCILRKLPSGWALYLWDSTGIFECNRKLKGTIWAPINM